MNKYRFGKFERISKTEARKMYEMGFETYWLPCKLRPDNKWICGSYVSRFFVKDRDFDTICNAFAYYNCTNEVGKYIAFYRGTSEDYSLRFTFKNESNPYHFLHNTIENCMKELRKWEKAWKIQPLKCSPDGKTIYYELTERKEMNND